MKIVCLIKQVPRPDAIEFDQETRSLKREGVPLILNPFDARAVTEAVRLREAVGERHPLNELSMGMSNDFEVAVEEGATSVRLGHRPISPCAPRLAGWPTQALQLSSTPLRKLTIEARDVLTSRPCEGAQPLALGAEHQRQRCA